MIPSDSEINVDWPRKATMANKVMGSTNEKHKSQANEIPQILPDDNLDKEVASLMEKLKNLEIEEQSLLRNRRINKLKKMMEQKQKSVHDLSWEKEGQSTFMQTATSETMYDDASVSYPVVTTRNLKKMVGKLPQSLSATCWAKVTKMEMRRKCWLAQLVLAVEVA